MPAWCRPALVILAIFEVPAPAFAQERVPEFEVATLKLSPPPAGASISIVVGKGGSKLKAATEPPMPTAQMRGRISHKRMPMRLLASLLSRFEQQLVVDRTGLDGFYEVQLEWAPDTAALPTDAIAPPPDRPSLFAAVQEQLGLRLEGRRAPLDVVVIQQASQVPESN